MSDIFKNITYFDRLDSSSDYLIELHKKLQIKTNLVIVVNDQHKGRGRMGKGWFSNKESLTFSFSILLNSHIHSWHMNMVIGVALIRLLNNYSIQCHIKYPNDIIVKNKKIAGILTELISTKNQNCCIIGIGLNVNNELFPQNIPHAISMKNLISKKVNKNILLKSLLEDIRFLINSKSVNKLYISNLYGFKSYIRCVYKGCEMFVKILNVNKNGFLTIVTKEQSIITVNDIDIKFLIN